MASPKSQYTVKGGVIRDAAGVVVSKRAVAKDARRAADYAKGNAKTARSFPPAAGAAVVANKKLKQDAEQARDAILKANKRKR